MRQVQQSRFRKLSVGDAKNRTVGDKTSRLPSRKDDSMENWLLWELPPKFQELSRQICAWSGFAIWVGLAARVLVPAKFARSAWLTLCLGFAGSCLGPFAIKALFNVRSFDPVGPAGFLVATLVAAATLLMFYVVAFLAPPLADEEDEDDDTSKRIGRLTTGGRRDEFERARDDYRSRGEYDVDYREPSRRERRRRRG